MNQTFSNFPTPRHCAARITTYLDYDPPPSPTMDVNFRKIDIDQYDEDLLLDSELYDSDPRDPAQALDDTRQNAAAVRSSLSRCVFIL